MGFSDIFKSLNCSLLIKQADIGENHTLCSCIMVLMAISYVLNLLRIRMIPPRMITKMNCQLVRSSHWIGCVISCVSMPIIKYASPDSWNYPSFITSTNMKTGQTEEVWATPWRIRIQSNCSVNTGPVDRCLKHWSGTLKNQVGAPLSQRVRMTHL